MKTAALRWVLLPLVTLVIGIGLGVAVGQQAPPQENRPAIAYIKDGTLTEMREGGYVITESRDVTHWAENKSGAKVTLIGVDIVKP